MPHPLILLLKGHSPIFSSHYLLWLKKIIYTVYILYIIYIIDVIQTITCMYCDYNMGRGYYGDNSPSLREQPENEDYFRHNI